MRIFQRNLNNASQNCTTKEKWQHKKISSVTFSISENVHTMKFSNLQSWRIFILKFSPKKQRVYCNPLELIAFLLVSIENMKIFSGFSCSQSFLPPETLAVFLDPARFSWLHLFGIVGWDDRGGWQLSLGIRWDRFKLESKITPHRGEYALHQSIRVNPKNIEEQNFNFLPNNK